MVARKNEAVFFIDDIPVKPGPVRVPGTMLRENPKSVNGSPSRSFSVTSGKPILGGPLNLIYILLGKSDVSPEAGLLQTDFSMGCCQDVVP